MQITLSSFFGLRFLQDLSWQTFQTSFLARQSCNSMNKAQTFFEVCSIYSRVRYRKHEVSTLCSTCSLLCSYCSMDSFVDSPMLEM